MADTRLTSVIIPTRNRLSFLHEAIASVQSQSYPKWECIVVDDASSDGTSEWLRHLEDRRVSAVSLHERAGMSVARNRGLAEASGSSVLFLDDDDRLESYALERLTRAASMQGGTLAAVGGAVIFGDTTGHRRLPHVRRLVLGSIWREVLMGWCGQQGRTLFDRQAVLDAGGWSEGLSVGEDHELWLRIARMGPVAVIPEVVTQHRLHDRQWSAEVSKREWTREVVEREHAWRAEFVRRLPAYERQEGLRILSGWEYVRIGDKALGEGHYGVALKHFLEAAQAAPVSLRSPLLRPLIVPRILRAAVGSMLGGSALRSISKAKATFRSLRARYPYRGW